MKIQSSNNTVTPFQARFANDKTTAKILKNVLDFSNKNENYTFYKTIKCLENMKSEDSLSIDYAIDSYGYIISNNKTGAKVEVNTLLGPYALYTAITKNLTKLFEDTSIKNPNGHKFIKLSKIKPTQNYIREIKKGTENSEIQDKINRLHGENNSHKKQIETNNHEINNLERQQLKNESEYILSLIK